MEMDRDVRCVSAAAHNDAALASLVHPCVHCPPGAVEEHLEPGAEILRWRADGDINVRDVAEHIASWDVQRSAEAHGDVVEIAAYP